MATSLRLDILRDLRQRAGLTQGDMARLCGLHGRQSHQTAGAWERGEMIPNRSRRAKFIGYLWDYLGLGRDPHCFEDVWTILVEEWDWEPISDREWATYTTQLRSQYTSALDNEVAHQGVVLGQVHELAPLRSAQADGSKQGISDLLPAMQMGSTIPTTAVTAAVFGTVASAGHLRQIEHT
jgi:transcriptional regulator with XRE-family HTH domain